MRILKTFSVSVEQNERGVDQLQEARWEVKKRPGVFLILGTEDKQEARTYFDKLIEAKTLYPTPTAFDISIQPPAISRSIGPNYFIRVDGIQHPGEIEISASRAANPPHARNKKSFIEILDASYQAKDTLDVFFKTLLGEWGSEHERMTPESFCQWMAEKNENTKHSEDPTITNTIFYQWLQKERKYKLSGRSIDKMLTAFVPDDTFINLAQENPPYLQHRHALKFYRILTGIFIDKSRMQQRIEQKTASVSNGSLFADLIEESGIDPELLARWADVNLADIRNGNHIRNGKGAEKFVNLINPPTLDMWAPDDVAIKHQNLKLAAILTGRPLDLKVEDMIGLAKKSATPKNELFNLLLGPQGRTRVSDSDLASYLTKILNRVYTPTMINTRRLGHCPVNEEEAIAIAKRAGCSLEEIEPCVEILTGYKSVEKLLDDVLSDNPEKQISLSEMFRLARQRKGISQENLSISQGMASVFETSGRAVIPRSANAMADDIGLKGLNRRKFLLLAEGRPILNDAEIISKIGQAKTDPTYRSRILADIFDQTGVAREVLAKELGTYRGMLGSWVQRGHINATQPKTAEVVAKYLFLNGSEVEFTKAFNEVFLSPIAKQSHPDSALEINIK